MATNSTTAEDRLAKLGIHLPDALMPFGASAVQMGNLLFLSGMLATAGHTATVVGVVGKALDAKMEHIRLTEAVRLTRDAPRQSRAEVHLGKIGGVKPWQNPTTFAIRR